jgi:hypothetical protein
MKKNKPTPKTPLATLDNITPHSTTTPPQAKKKQAQKPMTMKKKQDMMEACQTKQKLIPTPLGACNVATYCSCAHVLDEVLTSDQPYKKTEECCSA